MKGNGIKLIEKVKSEAKKQENQEISYVDAALGAAVELAYGEVLSKVLVFREGYLLTRIFADEIKQKKQGYDKIKELFALGIASKSDYETAVTGSTVFTVLSAPEKIVKATKDYLRSACADAGINDTTVMNYIKDNHPQIASLAHKIMQSMPEQILKKYEHVLDDANAKFFDPSIRDYFPPEYSNSSHEQKIYRAVPSNSSSTTIATSKNDEQFFDSMTAKVIKQIQTEFSATSELIKHQDKVRAYENLKSDFRELGYIAGNIASSFGNPKLGRQITTSIVGTVTICDKLAQLGAFGSEMASLTTASSALTSMGAAGAGLSAAMPYVAVVGAAWSIMSSFFADDDNDGLSEALEAIMESLSVINSNVVAVHKAVETLRQECYEYHMQEMHALIAIYNQNKKDGRKFNQFRNELRAKFFELQKDNNITHQKLDTLTNFSVGYFEEITIILRNTRINKLEMYLEKIAHAVQGDLDANNMHLLLQKLRNYAVKFATETSINGGAISLNSQETIISRLKSEKSHSHSLGLLANYFKDSVSVKDIAHPGVIVMIAEALKRFVTFQIQNPVPSIYKDRNLEYMFEIRRELVKIREFRKNLFDSKAFKNLILDCINELNKIKQSTEKQLKQFEQSLHDARAQVIKDSFKKDREKILARTSYPTPNYMNNIQNAYHNANTGAEYGNGVLVRLNYRPHEFSYTSGGTVVPGWSSEVSEFAQGNFSAIITANQKSCYDEYLKNLFGSHYDDLRAQLINSSVFNIFSAPNIGNGAFGLSRTIDITYKNTTVTVGCSNFIPIEGRYLIAENYGLGKIIYKGEILQNKLLVRTYFKLRNTDQLLSIGHFEKDFTPSIDSNEEFVIMQCWYGGRDIKSTSEVVNINEYNGKAVFRSRPGCKVIYPKATTYPRLASNGGYASVAIPNIHATQQLIDGLNQDFLVNKCKEFCHNLFLNTEVLEEKFYVLRTALQFLYGLYSVEDAECLTPFSGFDPSFKTFKSEYKGEISFINDYIDGFIIKFKNLENYIEYQNPMPDDILDSYIGTLESLINQYSAAISGDKEIEKPIQKDITQILLEENASMKAQLLDIAKENSSIKAQQSDMANDYAAIRSQLSDMAAENAKMSSQISDLTGMLKQLMGMMSNISKPSTARDLVDSSNSRNIPGL